MQYPAFSYTPTMQILLFFISCGNAFLFFWFVTNVLLTIYGEKVSVRRRVVFTFLTGVVLNQWWVYSVYILSGCSAFSPQVYLLVTVPNPIFALLYYFISIHILKLSNYCSIHLMRHVFLYIVTIKTLNRVVIKTFFAQPEGAYNYLLEAISLMACSALNITLYLLIIYGLKRTRFFIHLRDNMLTRSLWYELSISFLQACGVYLFVLWTPQILPSLLCANLFTLIILTLLLVLSILKRYLLAIEMEMENKDAYIHSLIGSIDRFDRIRHDFNNILQTYGGYISIGSISGLKKYHAKLMATTLRTEDELELSQRAEENPTLATLLKEKSKYAKACEVAFRMEMQCSLEAFWLSHQDTCCAVGKLLDNAIEAASASEQRRVSLSIREKPDGSKLIIISNSTEGDVDLAAITLPKLITKQGHSGNGIPEVRRILGGHADCSLQFSYYDREFFVFIEILANPKKE